MAAPDIRNSWRSKAAGAMMGLAALVPGGLAAQDATSVAYTRPSVTAEMEALETREGLIAIRGASAFAESCDTCVGVVFAKGDDFRKSVYDRAVEYLNERGAPLSESNMNIVSSKIEDVFMNHYQEQYSALFAPMGVQAKLFPRTNFAPEDKAVRSGVSFHVGQVVYENESGRGSFLLNEVDAELAVDVVDMLSYMWQNDPELVSRLDDDLSPAPSGG